MRSFGQDENELKSLRNPWDDIERRPSHREKLCVMRKKRLWELYFEQYTDRVNRDLLNEIYENLFFTCPPFEKRRKVHSFFEKRKFFAKLFLS